MRVFIALLKRFGQKAFYLICSRQQIVVEMLKAIFLTCKFAEKGLSLIHIFRFDLNGTVTLLQEDDVGHNFRTGVGAERIVCLLYTSPLKVRSTADRILPLSPLRDWLLRISSMMP